MIAALPCEYEFHVGPHRCVRVEQFSRDIQVREPSNIRQVLFTCKAQFVQARVEMVLHEAAAHGVAFEKIERLLFERRCEVCGSGAGGAARVRVVVDAVQTECVDLCRGVEMLEVKALFIAISMPRLKCVVVLPRSSETRCCQSTRCVWSS
jgi:hypothetical protein